MTEEKVVTPIVEETESEGETPEVTNAEKVFKQAEVDSLIKNRLNREKAAAKLALESATAEANAHIEELKTQVDSYEKLFKPLVDEAMKTQSEPVKKLLQKLSLQEQWEFLSNSENQVAKKQLPSTPKSESNGEQPKTKKLGTII